MHRATLTTTPSQPSPTGHVIGRKTNDRRNKRQRTFLDGVDRRFAPGDELRNGEDEQNPHYEQRKHSSRDIIGRNIPTKDNFRHHQRLRRRGNVTRYDKSWPGKQSDGPQHTLSVGGSSNWIVTQTDARTAGATLRT